MARSRNIKPGFFLNEELAEIEPLGRLLFAGLWTIADKEGRIEDRPKRIKIGTLPYDNCDIDALLQVLADKGFILRYLVNDEGYIQINNWHKHQRPHIKEAPSEMPPPGGTGQAPEIPGQKPENPEPAPNQHLTDPPDSLILNTDSLILNTDTLNTDNPNGGNSGQCKKINYAEFVKMTKAEYQKLVTAHGEEFTKCCIETLDNAKGAKGYKYKSDYRAILSWVVKRVTEEQARAPTKPGGVSKYAGVDDTKYDPEKLPF